MAVSSLGWRIAAIGVLGLLAAACSSRGSGAPAGTPEPSPTKSPMVFRPTFAYGPCEFALPEGQVDGKTAACGTLTVLERRDGTSQRTIGLAVAILRATGGVKLPDPLIYLSGGPGGSAIDNDMTLFTAEFAAPIQQQRDIIFFDQRGVGHSKPALACSEFRLLYFAQLLDADDPQNTALTQCRDRLKLGTDLAAYNSAASAADILDLADALGYDQYNLYGVSYGTRLALTAMRDAPARVRSAVLDSTVPLQSNLYADHAAAFESALGAMFDACAADATCRSVAPGLESTFYRLVARLNAEPEYVMVQDVGTGALYRTAIDGDAFLGILFQAFYVKDLLHALPLGIVQVSNGDTRMLSVLASYSSRRAGDSIGMYLSVQCAEEAHFNSAEALTPVRRASSTALLDGARAQTASILRECVEWGVPQAAAYENAAVVSDVPSLVLAGQFDPVTPPWYGRLAAETLSRGQFFEFPGVAHGVLDTGCAMDITAAFLADPLTAPDAGCIAAMPPLTFSDG